LGSEAGNEKQHRLSSSCSGMHEWDDQDFFTIDFCEARWSDSKIEALTYQNYNKWLELSDQFVLTTVSAP